MLDKRERTKSSEEATNPKDLLGAQKPPMELIPPTFEVHLAQAFKNGAKKYNPYNWRSKRVKASIYVGAAKRHIAQWYDGEENAKDSGAHHLAHAAACLAILLDAKETGNLHDDRPPPGKASKMIEDFTEHK